MLRSTFSRIALAAVAMAAFSAPDARAELQIQISVNGGAFQNFSGGSGTTVNPATITINGVNFSISGSTNQPLGTMPSQISQSNLVINGGASGATFSSIVIQVTSTGFTVPTGNNLQFSSSLSGSYGAGVSSASNQTFQSFVNLANALFGTGQTGGAQNFGLPSVSGTTALANTLNSLVNVSATPFSMTNTFTLSNISIGSGAQLQLTGTTTLSSVPEPATIISALVGLPILGAWRLRRRQTKATV